MISAEDISFCIQGPVVSKVTERLIASIRTYFPDSTIIYAVWENDVAKLKMTTLPSGVKIVKVRDPGSHLCVENEGIYLNAQRQIVSARAAIKAATTEYVVKIRSDLLLKNTKIITAINQLKKIDPSIPYHLGTHQIGALNVTTINPEVGPEMPFHLCDWVYLGSRKDLVMLFNSDYPEHDYADWYVSRPKPKNNIARSNARFSPESFIFSKYVQQHTYIDFEHSFDTKNNNIEISKEIIKNNICIFRLKDLGLVYTKREHRKLILHNDQMYQPFDILYARNEISKCRFLIRRYLFRLQHKIYRVFFKLYSWL